MKFASRDQHDYGDVVCRPSMISGVMRYSAMSTARPIESTWVALIAGVREGLRSVISFIARYISSASVNSTARPTTITLRQFMLSITSSTCRQTWGLLRMNCVFIPSVVKK